MAVRHRSRYREQIQCWKVGANPDLAKLWIKTMQVEPTYNVIGKDLDISVNEAMQIDFVGVGGEFAVTPRSESETARRSSVAKCSVQTQLACESTNRRNDRAWCRQASDARDTHCNIPGTPPTFVSDLLSSKRTHDRDIGVELFQSLVR